MPTLSHAKQYNLFTSSPPTHVIYQPSASTPGIVPRSRYTQQVPSGLHPGQLPPHMSEAFVLALAADVAYIAVAVAL